MAQETNFQPDLSDLLARFLNKQADAHAAGTTDLGAPLEVTPYEAGPVQPVDAKAAWEEAVAALAFYQPGAKTAGWQMPPHWASMVAAHEPALAIAFCLGNYPQLLRDFQGIVHNTSGARIVPSPGRALSAPALSDWASQVAAKKRFAQMLLALGCLRLANQFDEAERYQRDNDAVIPSEWRAGWENEKAALAWHQGCTDEARAQWDVQAASVPVLFNRGMSELLLGDGAKGQAALQEAIANLPERSAWHHLAKVYLLMQKR